MNRLDSPNYFLQALIFNMQDRVRSAVLLYPPLKDIRGFTARLVVCIGTLWHFFFNAKTQRVSHRNCSLCSMVHYKLAPSPHSEGHVFIFCVESALMLLWICSKDLQANRAESSKLSSVGNRRPSYNDIGDPFDIMSNFVYPMPAESLQIYTQPHQSEHLYEDHILLHFCSLFRIRESSKFEMTKTLHPCIDFFDWWWTVRSRCVVT